MEPDEPTPLGLLEDAGYRVEVAEEYDERTHERRFHALAIDACGDYRLVSASSQSEAIAELARQLGLKAPGEGA
jgi:hypothetical protein